MPYSYSFKAFFIHTAFNNSLLNTAVPTAEKLFNSVPRKKGHKKHLTVRINTQQRFLEFDLQSDVKLDPINYLRSSQYFSKALSLQPGMAGYIVDGRMLVQ